MRKLLLSVLMAMFCLSQVQGQSEISFDEQGCFSLVVETNATAKQIYTYSKSFFSSAIKDFQKSLQIDDPEQNKIQISSSIYLGDIPLTIVVNGQPVTVTDCYEEFKMTVTGKDGRYRVKTESPDDYFSAYGGTNSKPYSSFKDFSQNLEQLNDVRKEQYSRITNQLQQYIENQIAEEDF